MAHAVWVSKVPPHLPGLPTFLDDHITYSRSSDNGETWSTSISLTSISGDPDYILHLDTSSIKISSDGDYVGIAYVRKAGNIAIYDLLYSDDSGATWHGPIDVSAVDIPDERPYIDIDWQGDTAFIVLKNNTLGIGGMAEFHGIAFRTFANGVPAEVENLLETNGYGIPRIAVDNNDIHIVFCAPDSTDPSVPSNEAIYLHGVVSPRSWDAPITIATYEMNGIPFTQKAFDLVAEDGQVYFVWNNYDTDNYNIWYVKATSPFQQLDWGSPIQVITDSANSLYPACVLDSSSNLYIVWQDDRDGYYQLRYSRIDALGGTDVDDMALTDTDANAINPDIAVDEVNGRVYLSWEDFRSGAPEIFLKRGCAGIITGCEITCNDGIEICSLNSEIHIQDNRIFSRQQQGINILGGAANPSLTSVIERNIISCGDSIATFDSCGIYVEGGVSVVSGNHLENQGLAAVGIRVGAGPVPEPCVVPLVVGTLEVSYNDVLGFNEGVVVGGAAPSIEIIGNTIASCAENGMRLSSSSAPVYKVEGNELTANAQWGLVLQDVFLLDSSVLSNENEFYCNQMGQVLCQWSYFKTVDHPMKGASGGPYYWLDVQEADNTVLGTIYPDSFTGNFGPMFLTEFHVTVGGNLVMQTPHVMRYGTSYSEKYLPPMEEVLTMDQPDIGGTTVYSYVPESVDFVLPAGVSYISLPLVNDALLTASDLAVLVGLEFMEVSYWDATTQSTLTYPGTDFDLTPGAHYALTVSGTGASFTLTGYRAGVTEMGLTTGTWNDIGWIGLDNIMASDFSVLVPGFLSVAYYDGSGWISYDGIPAQDFVMEPGKGYRLFVSASGLLSYSEGELDLDDDGLICGEEQFIYGTNYQNPTTDFDTDADGIADEWEANFCLNPLVDDSGGDMDGDGLSNVEEYTLGTYPNWGDTDHDGLTDYEEAITYGTDPLSDDTDSDGMADKYEVECKLAGGIWNPIVPNDRYAVLFVGGINSFYNYGKYWNQLIKEYDMLKYVYGYRDENIFVLYANGQPPNNNNYNGWPEPAVEVAEHAYIIDSPATLFSTSLLFFNLRNIVDSTDFLYIWTYDHGGALDVGSEYPADPTDTEQSFLCCWREAGKYNLSDERFALWLSELQYARVAIVMGQCFAGGFIDDLQRQPVSNYVISTSVGYTSSSSSTYAGYLYHHMLAFTPACGNPQLCDVLYTKGRYSDTSADANSDSLVSMYEAFIYAEANNDYGSHDGSGGPETGYPRYYESQKGLGVTTFR